MDSLLLFGEKEQPMINRSYFQSEIMNQLEKAHIQFHLTGSILNRYLTERTDLDLFTVWSKYTEQFLLDLGFKEVPYDFTNPGEQGLVKVLRYKSAHFRIDGFTHIDIQLLYGWSVEFKQRIHEKFGYVKKDQFLAMYRGWDVGHSIEVERKEAMPDMVD